MPRGRRSTSTKAKPKLLWNADGVDSESPSSLDVLFQWLHVPGNYQRWQTQNKLALCREVVECLEQEGVTHRNSKSVCMKMINLKKTFESATNWLVEHGQYDAFRCGEVTKDVQCEIQKLCPYYDELAPILGGAPGSASHSEDQSEPRADADKQQQKRRRLDFANDSYDASTEQSRSRESSVQASGEADVEPKLSAQELYLFAMEVKSRKTRLEADNICNKALNRKKMLDAGIDREEVDRLLPQ